MKTRTSEVRASEALSHKERVNTTLYKQLLCRELFITLKTRIFIEIVFITQIKNKNSRTWSRKVAINTSTSLAPIFSISLSSFLESNIFLSNKTPLCGLLYVFLFS